MSENKATSGQQAGYGTIHDIKMWGLPTVQIPAQNHSTPAVTSTCYARCIRMLSTTRDSHLVGEGVTICTHASVNYMEIFRTNRFIKPREAGKNKSSKILEFSLRKNKITLKFLYIINQFLNEVDVGCNA